MSYTKHIKTLSNEEFRRMNSNTAETTPLHHWKDHVQMEVLRRVGPEVFPGLNTWEWITGAELNSRLVRAYQAGEPVWMAVDEFVQRAQGAILAHIAGDGDLTAIRAALRHSS